MLKNDELFGLFMNSWIHESANLAYTTSEHFALIVLNDIRKSDFKVDTVLQVPYHFCNCLSFEGSHNCEFAQVTHSNQNMHKSSYTRRKVAN